MAGQTAEQQLEAWIARHPGWTHKTDAAGAHVVKDPRGGLAAWNEDPAVVLEDLRRQA